MNTFKWYLGISVLVLISACTSYNIQKRHYTKGLYVSFLHKTTDPFKKNSSPKRSSANAPAKLTLTQNQTALNESIEATKLISYNPITDLKPPKPLQGFECLTNQLNNRKWVKSINPKHSTYNSKSPEVLKNHPAIIKTYNPKLKTNENTALTALVLLMLLALDIVLGVVIFWIALLYFYLGGPIVLILWISLIALGLACTIYFIKKLVEFFKT